MSDFGVAMLTTHSGGEEMRARPLAIADKHADGELYFATAVESPKVGEIEANPHLKVTMQDGRRFVSITEGRVLSGSRSGGQIVVRIVEGMVSAG